jgi:hypothetical protein
MMPMLGEIDPESAAGMSSEAEGGELPAEKTPAVGPLETERGFEVEDKDGNPITDIDRFQGDTLVEEKSIEGFNPENQTAENWAVEDGLASRILRHGNCHNPLDGLSGRIRAAAGFRMIDWPWTWKRP